MKKAVISCSGGLDSTCLLLKLLSEGYEVRTYAFKYGQKHSIELSKVQQNIGYLSGLGYPVTLQVIDLRDCFSDSASSLHEGGEKIPEGDYRDETMKSTVVENRNVIFSAIIYGKFSDNDTPNYDLIKSFIELAEMFEIPVLLNQKIYSDNSQTY